MKYTVPSVESITPETVALIRALGAVPHQIGDHMNYSREVIVEALHNKFIAFFATGVPFTNIKLMPAGRRFLKTLK